MELFKLVIRETTLNAEGRLVLPALWNFKVLDRLPNNYNLASNILKSVFKKISKDKIKLNTYDSVIKQYYEEGIITKISDLSNLKFSKGVSFLGHRAVFRESSESTKCRLVLMSNVCQKGEGNLSMNQVSLPGPQLNSKITATVFLYRFNKYLMLYDLRKAFLQLVLKHEDSMKMHILWFEDVANENFNLVAYKFNRVPFGTRFSPSLLLVALYIMLVLHANISSEEDNSIRNMIYNLSYMDNMAYSSENELDILRAYHFSHELFGSFKFELQQFYTNSSELNAVLKNSDIFAKFFGLTWNTREDTLEIRKPFLNSSARTKRQILETLNSNYDPLGILLPIFNRGKLFLHELQCNPNLDWDTPLDVTHIKNWKNICNQLNNSKNLVISRYIGDYSEEFEMYVFTDASKDIYGCVIYLKSINSDTLHFIQSKNRIVSKTATNRSIPILELLAVEFGV